MFKINRENDLASNVYLITRNRWSIWWILCHLCVVIWIVLSFTLVWNSIGNVCLIKSSNKTSKLHIPFCCVIQIGDNDNCVNRMERKRRKRKSISARRRRTKKGQLSIDVNICSTTVQFESRTKREKKSLVELIRCQSVGGGWIIVSKLLN